MIMVWGRCVEKKGEKSDDCSLGQTMVEAASHVGLRVYAAGRGVCVPDLQDRDNISGMHARRKILSTAVVVVLRRFACPSNRRLTTGAPDAAVTTVCFRR